MPFIPATLIALLILVASLAHADLLPYDNDPEYDDGSYGSYPKQTFKSFDIEAPRPNVVHRSEGCNSRAYTFIAPRGKIIPATPMILDQNQQMVFASREYQNVYDFRVQQWRGKPHLTLWTGKDQVRGHGTGDYRILDSSYKEVKRVQAGNGMKGDLHEFLITEKGTALITVYHVVEVDLGSVGGPKKGYIYESIFQEMDLETDEILFQWVAREHYDFKDTYRPLGPDGTKQKPWDWFHINSIEKDPKGNFLISARYTHSLTYIDGESTKPIWILGGKRNEFTDLSDGKATNFAGQHDARWHNGYQVITLFDNAGDYDKQFADESRGIRLRMDFKEMNVKLEVEYKTPQPRFAASQASMQVLPSGNVLLGYGFNGFFAEFAHDGKLLCEVHFEAASAFTSGDIQSYRTSKKPWIGKPQNPPDAVFEKGVVYVSWNGATEVYQWMLQALDPSWGEAGYRAVDTVVKDGFETAIPCDEANVWERYVRVVALNRNGTELGMSKKLDIDYTDMTRLEKTWSNTRDYSTNVFTVVIILFLVLIAVFYFWRRMNTSGTARVRGIRVGSVSESLGSMGDAMREKGILGGLLSAASRGRRSSSGLNGRGKYTTVSNGEA
ncbi:MAG: hypothetical protein M1831_002825 [Alyxoria varia]|nr:MAG: hypothetical protein M1831_002825 [Alyxoria varia]